MKKFLERQPFVLLGAFGILALIDGLLQLPKYLAQWVSCRLYTTDAADEEDSGGLGGRPIVTKKLMILV